MEVLPISVPVKKAKFDVYESFKRSSFRFKDNDILVISSKYVSMGEGAVVSLSKIRVSTKARLFASKYCLSAKMAELILRESDYIFRGIPGYILSVRDGIIAPNAGIDRSNVPDGFAVLYPRQPFISALKIRTKFFIDASIKVGIVIADSRLMPTRIGTTGVAIAVSGFEPVEDQRGKKDLFGNVLKVTFKAVADSLATIGVAVMGESNEAQPAAAIRGLKVISTERRLTWHDIAVDSREDIYIRELKGSKTFVL